MNQILEWLSGTKQQELSGQAEWGFKFLADHGPYLNLLIILALAGLVLLTIRSYRREGDAKTSVKAVLGALRIAVIVVLVAILFRPAIVFKLVKTLHSVVVVLADDSQSMSFSDRYADAGYQKNMAEFFKITPAQLGGKTRLELYKDALLRKDGAMADLAKDHRLILMRFSTTQPGRESYVCPLGDVDVVRDDNGGSPSTGEPPAQVRAALKPLAGLGLETNPAEAIRGALEATQGQRVQAIVFVSDGQPTTEDADNRLIGALDYARQRGVPIMTVAVGDPTLPKNIAVTGLQGPREARKGSEVEFTAMLAQRNLDGQTVVVQLQRRLSDRKGWEEVARQSVRLVPADVSGAAGSKGMQSVVFKTKPEGAETGLAEKKKFNEYVYRAYVEPRPDEQNIADNSAETLVRIVDSKINVLLIAGDSGWEFQYLRNLLQRQNDLYRVSVWQQNAEKEVSQAASSEDFKLERMPSDLVDLIGNPKDPKKPGYQVVILYDPRRTRGDDPQQPNKGGFDENFVAMLKDFVGSHGGGLCYIAGNKYTDDNLVSNAAFKDLETLLPVKLAVNRTDIEQILNDRTPEAWHAMLTEYGRDHQITRLGETAEKSAWVWENLPRIYWSHPVAGIKPAARVLLENENPTRQTVKGEREPLLALHMYGSGPVIYLGTDDTWRWREFKDAKYQKRFWNNIVGFLATLKASRVIITTGGDTFNAGERIKVEVEAYDEKYRPLTDASLTVDIVDTVTGASEKLILAKVVKKEGRYAGAFTASHRGNFEITAKGIENVESKRITVKLPEAEALRTETNEEIMRSMAGNDKNFLHVWEMDNLARMIPSGKLTSVQENPQELWDSRLLLAVLVVLLTAEWILRKKFNMA